MNKISGGGNFFLFGGILFAIGIISLLISGRNGIPHLIQVLIFVVMTISFYSGGYYLKYERKQYVELADVLIFLGSVLYGTTIFYTANLYQVQANTHWLVLLWMVGNIPVLYLMESVYIGFFTSLLFLAWSQLFVFGDFSRMQVFSGEHFILVFLFSLLMLFSVLGWHYAIGGYDRFLRGMRIGIIFVVLIIMFGLTFGIHNSFPYAVKISILMVGGISILCGIITFLVNPTANNKNISIVEAMIMIVISAIYMVNVYILPDHTMHEKKLLEDDFDKKKICIQNYKEYLGYNNSCLGLNTYKFDTYRSYDDYRVVSLQNSDTRYGYAPSVVSENKWQQDREAWQVCKHNYQVYVNCYHLIYYYQGSTGIFNQTYQEYVKSFNQNENIWGLVKLLLNLAVLIVILGILYIGYMKTDIVLKNAGYLFLIMLAVTRFFDTIADWLSTSAYFLLAGIIVLLVGFFKYYVNKNNGQNNDGSNSNSK